MKQYIHSLYTSAKQAFRLYTFKEKNVNNNSYVKRLINTHRYFQYLDIYLMVKK